MADVRMRIVVAMSGGVDSSVAAALLVEAGHDVVGVSMQLYDASAGEQRFGTCCTIDDLHDARRVAHGLGIPHYVVNLERRFQDVVVSNFVREYAVGRTPIPCAHCNSELKFSTLVEQALGFAAARVATGHYARVTRDAAGVYHLWRGTDDRKDQAYFLFALTQAQLARALFPVGELSKDEVRRLALARGLRVADKPDSQEICFVPDGEYAAVVDRHLPGDRSGLVVDAQGRVLGRHDGVHHFTVGQRKGLGISAAEPLYVVKLDADRRLVEVGPKSALERRTLAASGVNWVAGAPPAGDLRAQVQIRSRHAAAEARVTPLGSDRMAVTFDAPQSAITPGQAAVVFQGGELLGGGWIE
ncbi:MAG: tRNA 2-thiouridine(34) synthase MnmA [Vicinamibacterales bacterium]|nr:tRNA 2-thiouridine(34) synthase MnmA [Vicinamibacterales bacterium]